MAERAIFKHVGLKRKKEEEASIHKFQYNYPNKLVSWMRNAYHHQRHDPETTDTTDRPLFRGVW